jgi:hypothetical protein
MNELLDSWRAQWPTAISAWSAFTKLSEPRWCLVESDEEREGLTGSFAMIRLNDHAVVISLKQVQELGLQDFGAEVLAHEIGHHVYAPGDLRDAGRLLARIRHGIPTREGMAPMVSNLYTDLLINDRLQRQSGLDIAGVYAQLNRKSPPSDSKLWAFYMRTYEILWNLERGSLANPKWINNVQLEAELGARLVRVYAKDWMRGGGRFGSLVLRFLIEENPEVPGDWLDAMASGGGDYVPDGLADIEDDEVDGAIHPAFDPELTGLEVNLDETDRDAPGLGGRATTGGQKNNYRSPSGYVELMKSLGVKVSEKELVTAYYRERASHHMIRFPSRISPKSTEPHPEGLDVWDPGSPVSSIDWVESMIRSPIVIPGVTTYERLQGYGPGGEPEREPIDLYLGIDCSGSMGNPAHMLSYPVLAGTVMLLSALRAKARVMVCLSGEPGSFSETDGFIRDERALLTTLTSYLGTGYAFGIKRLEEQFITKKKPERPCHALVISDSDMFMMMRDTANGQEIMEAIPQLCEAGATMVLQLHRAQHEENIAGLEAAGWNVHTVTSMEEVLSFAAAFSRQTWEEP